MTNWIKFYENDKATWPPLFEKDYESLDKYFLAIMKNDPIPFVTHRSKGGKFNLDDFINWHEWQQIDIKELSYWQRLPEPPIEQNQTQINHSINNFIKNIQKNKKEWCKCKVLPQKENYNLDDICNYHRADFSYLYFSSLI